MVLRLGLLELGRDCVRVRVQHIRRSPLVFYLNGHMRDTATEPEKKREEWKID